MICRLVTGLGQGVPVQWHLDGGTGAQSSPVSPAVHLHPKEAAPLLIDRAAPATTGGGRKPRSWASAPLSVVRPSVARRHPCPHVWPALRACEEVHASSHVAYRGDSRQR